MGNKNAKPKGQYLLELHKKVPNMNMDEILQVFEDFQRQSRGRGRLSKSDFVKVYKQAFEGKNGVKALAENIFTAFDTDNSGYVDFEEFLVGLSITEASLADVDKESKLKRLKWAFNVYDKDKSGTIDRNEMRAIVRAVADVVPDNSFLQGLSPQKYSDRLFAEVDANGDGDITFEEFRKAVKQNETLFDLLLPSPT
ncbi:neuronal calcium sensor 2-like [Mya arenaria]|uniref:neuronal calcium sensor 2-like n=1 Tax=Mya arenaria TaxID=6604 RepID=UPI0022E8A4E4|nr:neuronal calcium sensor 2-like [Mya arenaria]